MHSIGRRRPIGPPVLRRMSGEAVKVSMVGSLFEVRRRVAASLGVPEHQIAMVSDFEEHQIAMLSGSLNTDVEKGSETVQLRRLTDLDLLTDACDIGGELTVLVESGQRDLRVGDEVRARRDLRQRDLRVGDVHVASGSFGTVESMREKDGAVTYKVSFPSGSLSASKDAWRTYFEFIRVGSNGIVPRAVMDEVEETKSFSMDGALRSLLAAVLIAVIPVFPSLYYAESLSQPLWILVFGVAAALWCMFCLAACSVDYHDTSIAWLDKASLVVSVALIPPCLAGMYLLADYGALSMPMRGVLQYNVTSNTLLALHGNGAAGICEFEHGPSSEHAVDSRSWTPQPFTGTHQVDIPCNLDVVGKKGKSASNCPGYVQFVLMPLWFGRKDRTLGSNRPTAFVFQYRVFIFNPWERDIRNREEQKKLTEPSWLAPDRWCAFNTSVPSVNALWSDYVAKNLTTTHQGIHVDHTYDLPTAWIDAFVSSAKHNLSIPEAEELPLLWMPSTAGSLLTSVEEQINWGNSRGLWGVCFFAVAIGSTLIASLVFFVRYYKSLRLQRRIQRIQLCCADTA